MGKVESKAEEPPTETVLKAHNLDNAPEGGKSNSGDDQPAKDSGEASKSEPMKVDKNEAPQPELLKVEKKEIPEHMNMDTKEIPEPMNMDTKETEKSEADALKK